ncbi:MAG: phosphoglucosamine mutase [Coriobacteriia bacterium]|nr:phosphoglucosamine mutase [Coriobacteriia bacterium]
MTRYFGTDGVRGVVNKELTCELAFALGVVAAETFKGRIIVGRDTRRSGAMLEAALISGITAAGGDAMTAGIVPTPAVSYLMRAFEAAGGAVISASHNPPEYNGIKFFDAGGFKPSPELEERIEKRLHELLENKNTLEAALAGSTEIGRVYPIPDAAERYITHALESITPRVENLKGLRVAVDCGHGAAALTTPQALARLKAKVSSINTSFDGNDINVGCGSTHLDQIKQLVAFSKADIGIAHDGDADRVIAIDAHGNEIDGDFIEMICACDLLERNALPDNTVVSTVMCNLGFTKAAAEQGIKVVQTAVGDSNVLAAMREGGYVLGGEQSGHMIFLEHNTTGDGLITALQILAIMKSQGKSLEELAQVMRKYPQELINVHLGKSKDEVAHIDLGEDTELAKSIAAIEEELAEAGGGRVLVRPSGTEPLIRVMVEAATEADAQKYASALAAEIQHRYGADAKDLS